MEMIYEDPTALKHLSPVEIKNKKSTCASTSNIAGTTQRLSSPESEHFSCQVKIEGEDVYYRSYCPISPPMSFASYSSSATTPFDSPHVSPCSDYSEFEISSPVSSCETAGYYSPISTTTTPSSCTIDNYNSPFSVLDSPFINDSNAYATNMNYDMGMIDYFHFNHSDANNINNAFKPTTTQVFSWTEPCEAFIATEQCSLHNLMQQVYDPPVRYINPVLLQLI